MLATTSDTSRQDDKYEPANADCALSVGGENESTKRISFAEDASSSVRDGDNPAAVQTEQAGTTDSKQRSESSCSDAAISKGTPSVKSKSSYASQVLWSNRPLQRVVYYQNRFITLPVIDLPHNGAIAKQTTTTGNSLNGTGTLDMAGQPAATSAVQGTAPGTPRSESQPRSLLATLARVVEDNRMKGADATEATRLQAMNTEVLNHRLLKTTLNVIFMMTGSALLIAVIVVILYAWIKNMLS